MENTINIKAKFVEEDERIILTREDGEVYENNTFEASFREGDDIVYEIYKFIKECAGDQPCTQTSNELNMTILMQKFSKEVEEIIIENAASYEMCEFKPCETCASQGFCTWAKAHRAKEGASNDQR